MMEEERKPVKTVAYEELENKKLEIENQLSELEKVLIQEGNVGLTGELVDAEGYPRADIDLYKVRLARQQINCLRNDYKQVLNLIEAELATIYSASNSSAAKNESSNGFGENSSKGRRPFCLITQVDAGSPASESGIQLNDEIIQFGPYVHGSVGKSLSEIGELVRKSENKIILVNVARKSAGEEKSYVKIKLVPKKWTGHGLLGCKLVPID